MAIYILTGQPHAGKTTLANLLKTSLNKSFVIDGDDLREILNNKDYSEAGRRKNIETAHSIAKYLHRQDNDNNIIISLVSPFRDLRDSLKHETGALEFYIHTSEIRGREAFHVAEYQEPIKNFTDIDTTEISEDESLKQILWKIGQKKST
jgi:adenylylsulfate kinase-like enzyme